MKRIIGWNMINSRRKVGLRLEEIKRTLRERESKSAERDVV